VQQADTDHPREIPKEPDHTAGEADHRGSGGERTECGRGQRHRRTEAKEGKPSSGSALRPADGAARGGRDDCGGRCLEDRRHNRSVSQIEERDGARPVELCRRPVVDLGEHADVSVAGEANSGVPSSRRDLRGIVACENERPCHGSSKGRTRASANSSSSRSMQSPERFSVVHL
jgi:hypothetical protein